MDHQPFFTVIITTYNRSALLPRALKSLVSQTEKDWEAIIVDDGSTDNTYSHIKDWLNTGSGIIYLRKDHGGVVSAKNHGIKVANGKFITFLDSDDEYRPDHLEKRKEYLLQKPDTGFLHGGVQITGNQYVPDKNNPSVRIHLNDCEIGGTFVIEKTILLSLGGFRDIPLGADNDLFERAVKSDTIMAEINFPTYIYHHENPDSITNMLYRKIQNKAQD
ncbi:MAG: glycosyltransferase family 2 protein [Bacteroidetes bacterium]|jgi:glycosyltransferase involved in cell wall biosynthesis|nr:glycosyltransferase family 2 protein [Bacteroidota bacterium]